MVRTIYKYELQLVDTQRIEMPAGAQLLAVAGQEIVEQGRNFARAGTFPMLWALVDTDVAMRRRLIGVVGTGNPAPDESIATYVGSALCPPFVWHVFDGGELDA